MFFYPTFCGKYKRREILGAISRSERDWLGRVERKGAPGLPGGIWLASVHLMEQILEAGAVLELRWVLPVLFVLGVLIFVIINYILVYNFSSNQSPSVVFFSCFHDLAQSHMYVAVLFQILKMMLVM